MKKKIKVVAAVIENDQNEVLCALRSNDMSLPNMWEFPGGKVEEGEDIYSAIVREIEEELHCKIKATELHNEHTHEYDTFIIELIAIKAEIAEGTPQPTEHAKLVWLNKENLHSLVWAPADVPAVELLVEKK